MDRHPVAWAVVERQRGEAGAFETLVREHQAPLYRGAYRLTGNHEDAQDLLQDALLEAFEAFPRFQPGTSFLRWVMRIMTHTFIDRTRRRSRMAICSLDRPADPTTGELAARDVPDSRPGPEGELLREMLEEPLQEALASLTPEFRLAVVLCDVQGLSYEEAARAARCPVGTIRSRLHRAREMMRRALGPSLSAVYRRGS